MGVVPSADYMIKIFMIPNHICLQWGPDQQVGREAVQELDGTTVFYVSRIKRDNAIIVGKATFPLGIFFGVDSVGEHFFETDDIEVLTIDEACTWSWLSYTSGEELPVGAVMGGHLASGSPIYVAKMYANNGVPAFGYYSIEYGMGRYELFDTRTDTTMDILVIL